MEPASDAIKKRKKTTRKVASTFSRAVDAILKISATIAVIAAAIIANKYQSKITAVSLLSQREQSESALRSSMFSDLIGPIVGPQGNTLDMHPDRERLLVELLALNFHQHFELKPLLLHADQQLADTSNLLMNKEERHKARESLRSIARRVIDRQIAILFSENSAQTNPQAAAQFIEFTLVTESVANMFKELGVDSGAVATKNPNEYLFGSETINATSPDQKYTLTIIVSEPDWYNQTVKVLLSVTSNVANAKLNYPAIASEFTLTWFDFPFTDHTLLSDGNRFSIVLRSVWEEQQVMTLKLIWFPKSYFAPSERPINYRQFREKLGINIAE